MRFTNRLSLVLLVLCFILCHQTAAQVQWPLPNGVVGAVAGTPGEFRSSQGGRYHGGTDITNGGNTDVHCISAGTVSFIYYSATDAWNSRIIINGVTYYHTRAAVGLKVNDQVAVGDFIGSMFQYNGQPALHVHIEHPTTNYLNQQLNNFQDNTSPEVWPIFLKTNGHRRVNSTSVDLTTTALYAGTNYTLVYGKVDIVTRVRDSRLSSTGGNDAGNCAPNKVSYQIINLRQHGTIVNDVPVAGIDFSTIPPDGSANTVFAAQTNCCGSPVIFNYVVTSSSHTTPYDRYWNTLLDNDRTETWPNNNSLDAPVAPRAHHTDGIYRVEVTAEDIDAAGNSNQSTWDGQAQVRPRTHNVMIDNFRPYIAKVEVARRHAIFPFFAGTPVYTGEWVWENNILNFQVTTKGFVANSGNEDLLLTITPSEPMATLQVSITGLPSIQLLPTNTDRTEFVGSLRGFFDLNGKPAGIYPLNITGTDLAGNPLEAMGLGGISSNRLLAAEIPKHRADLNNPWLPNPTPGTDTKHRFQLGAPCTPPQNRMQLLAADDDAAGARAAGEVSPLAESCRVVDFSTDKTTAIMNEAVQFSDLSGDGEGVLYYYWKFGDGANPATSTSANPPPVRYSSAGSKTVRLEVCDDNGCIFTDRTAIVTIGTTPPVTLALAGAPLSGPSLAAGNHNIEATILNTSNYTFQGRLRIRLLNKANNTSTTMKDVTGVTLQANERNVLTVYNYTFATGNYDVITESSTNNGTSWLPVGTQNNPYALTVNTVIPPDKFTAVAITGIDVDPVTKQLKFIFEASPSATPDAKVVDLVKESELIKRTFLQALRVPNSKHWISIEPDPSYFSGNSSPDLSLSSPFPFKNTTVANVMFLADVHLKRFWDSEFKRDCWAYWNTLVRGSSYWSSLQAKGFDNLVFCPSRAAIIQGDVSANASAENIFVNNSQIGVESSNFNCCYVYSSPLPLSRLTGAEQAELNRLVQIYSNYYTGRLAARATTFKSIMNTAPEFDDMRKLYRAISLAQWYKKQPNKSPYLASIIDSDDIGTLADTPVTLEEVKVLQSNISFRTSTTGPSGTQEYFFLSGGARMTSASPSVKGELSADQKDLTATVVDSNTGVYQDNKYYYSGGGLTTPLADLYPVVLSTGGKMFVQPGALTIKAQINNAGNAAAADFKVSYYVKHITSGQTTSIGDTTIKALAPFSDIAVSKKWTPERPGEYTLSIKVDENLVVPETREDNNLQSANLSVAPNILSAEILEPLDGQSIEGRKLTLRVIAEDNRQGTLDGDHLVWKSDRSGTLGKGAMLVTNTLPIGIHVITMEATNDVGKKETRRIQVEVLEAGFPSLFITGPADQSILSSHVAYNFMSRTNDLVDGDVCDNVVWHSDKDGAIGTGCNIRALLKTPGKHVITATIVNSKGNSTARTLAVTVQPGFPALTVELPLPNATWQQHQPAVFKAKALDIQDGDLSANIVWTSTLDGELGHGANVSKSLSPGVHEITASIHDSHGLRSDSVFSLPITFTPPVIQMVYPFYYQEAAQGEMLNLRTRVYDIQDGRLKGAAVTWSSSLQGFLGNGDSLFTSQLLPGRHTITVVAKDSNGVMVRDTTGLIFLGESFPKIMSFSPPDNISSVYNYPLTFTAYVFDQQDGVLTGNSLVWTSSRDGKFGTGDKVTYAKLSPGQHTIRFSATDKNKNTTTKDVRITVLPSRRPAVTITGPVGSPATFVNGSSITLTANATDPDEGTLKGERVQWFSNLDNQFGTGSPLVTNKLSTGTHTISVVATDSTGLQATAVKTIIITQRPPVARITAPATGKTFYDIDSVKFIGEGSDYEDGTLIDTQLAWYSDVQGLLGSGTQLTKSNLTSGRHIIRLVATDGQGTTHTSFATITITPSVRPVLTLQSPTANAVYQHGEAIVLKAVAYDQDRQPLPGSSIVWRSGTGDLLGTGNTVTLTTLAPGNHVLSATVTDGLGRTAATSVTITVVQRRPVATLTAPAQNATYNFGAPVTFAGSATDAEDGTLTGNKLVWASSRDGEIGTGQTFTTSTLSAGVHTIRLTAQDAAGATAYREVSISVRTPSAPVVTITSPTDNAIYGVGQTARFAATVGDPDQPLFPDANITWHSNINGVLGAGSALSTTALSIGHHLVTVTVTDATGLRTTATRQITIQQGIPTVAITAPADGTTFRALQDIIRFEGSANDPEDGALTGNALTWVSSIDGTLGTGTSLSAVPLSPGNHTIRLSATDGGGATGYDEIKVTVQPAHAPRVTLQAPAANAIFDHGASVAYTAQATDTEDGALPDGAITWTSDKDGVLGTGATLSRNTLSVGVHRITVRVVDKSGLANEAMVQITIRQRPPVVAITAPANGSVYKSGMAITFTGTGSDYEDGTYNTQLQWTSHIDGLLGTGASVSYNKLSPGLHTLYLSVTDAAGATATTAVAVNIETPHAPVVSIIAPKNNTTLAGGVTITFSALVSDADDGALTDDRIVWLSDKDGTLGTGKMLATNRLSPGTHHITLTATDATNLKTTAALTLTVQQRKPEAVILSPGDQVAFSSTSKIKLQGRATDYEDGPLTGSALSWHSSLAGPLGDGADLEVGPLQPGSHVITLTATDSKNATDAKSIVLLVQRAGTTLVNRFPVNKTCVDLVLTNLAKDTLLYIPLPRNARVNYAAMQVTGKSPSPTLQKVAVAESAGVVIDENEQRHWIDEAPTFHESRATLLLSPPPAAESISALAAADDVPDSERQALIALYNAMGGADWTTKTNWLSSNPVSTWAGVTVTLGHVTSLSFSNNNLTGTFPPEIANLTELKWFTVTGNKPTISFPNEMRTLKKIVSVILSESSLPGPFPAWVCDLPNLFQLGLVRTSISGPVPAEIGNLKLLETLTLGGNALTSLPAEIGDLPKLYSLDLYGNKNMDLSNLAAKAGSMKSLRDLALYQMNLAGNFPTWVTQFSALTDLDMSSNSLNGELPDDIKNLTNLQYLSLSGNQFTGNIPPAVFTLVKLVQLRLGGNQLAGDVSADIGKLTKLQLLALNDNQFTSIPVEIRQLTSLKNISLQYNRLTSFPELSKTQQYSSIVLNNNLLSFEDIEPNMGITATTFSYSSMYIMAIDNVTMLGRDDTVRVMTGKSHTLSINTGGTANQYQWKKGSSNIAGANASTYTIPAASRTDAGKYTCTVTSPLVPGLTLTFGWVTILVVNPYPQNPSIDVGDNAVAEWNKGGEFNNTIVTPDMAQAFNTYLDKYTGTDAIVQVPIRVKFSTPSVLSLCNLNLQYTAADTIPPLFIRASVSSPVMRGSNIVPSVTVTDASGIDSVVAILGNQRYPLFDFSGSYMGNVTATPAGTWPLTFIAYDKSGLSATYTVSLTILERTADLALGANSLELIPATPVAGSSLTVLARVANIGAGSVSQAPIALYTSRGLIATKTITINSGAEAVAEFTWLPAVADNFIRVVADPQNMITEANETNNEVQITLPLDDTTPPVVESIAATPSPATQHQSASLQVRASHNAGISQVRCEWQGQTRVLTYNTTTGLYESTAIMATVSGVTPCLCVVTGNNSVSTTRATDITVIPALPDLRTDKFNIVVDPITATSGQTVSVRATVYNDGGTRVPATDVQLVVNGAAVSTTTTAVSSTGSSLISFTWPATCGSHEFAIVIDPANRVAESNENNNTVAFPVSICTPQAPWVRNIAVPDTVLTGGTFVVQAAIEAFNTVGQVTASVQGTSYPMTYTPASGVYQVTVPAGTLTGTHTIQVNVVDLDGLEGTRKTTVVVHAHQADLVLSPLLVTLTPTTAPAGQTIRVSAVVTNTGRTNVPAARVTFAVDGVAQQTLVTHVDANSRVTVEFPWTALCGSHTFVLTVDPTNQVAESREDNNTAALPVTVCTVVPPVISSVVVPAVVQANNTFTVQATVVHDNLQQVTALYAGQAYTLQRNASTGNYESTIPAGNTLGIQYVDITAQSNDGLTAQRQASTQVVSPLPDLAVSPLDIQYVPESATPTQTVTINVTIRNTGSSAVSSVPVTLTANGLSQGNRAVAVDANNQATVSFPWPGTCGDVEFIVTVDPGNTIAEVLESNNTARSRHSFCIPQPPVNTEFVVTPDTLLAGEAFTVFARIQSVEKIQSVGLTFDNVVHTLTLSGDLYTGTIPTARPGVLPVNLTASNTSGLSATATADVTVVAKQTDLVVGNEGIVFTPVSIADGASVSLQCPVYNTGNTAAKNVAITLYAGNTALYSTHIDVPASGNRLVTLPFTAAISQPVLRVVADPNDEIRETNETNNTATVAIQVRDIQPPVIVSIETQPAALIDGDEVLVTAVVTDNVRVATVNATWQNVTISLYYNPTRQRYENTMLAKLPGGIVEVQAYDDAGLTARKTSMLRVSEPLPDLYISPTAIRWDTTGVYGGQYMPMTISVGNRSAIAVQQVPVAFVIEGQTIATRTINLAANAETTITFDWEVRCGNQAMSFVVDPANAVLESNEVNNQADVSVIACIPTPPVIADVYNNPQPVKLGDAFQFGATVTDDGSVASVTAHYQGQTYALLYDENDGSYETTLNVAGTTGSQTVLLQAIDNEGLQSAYQHNFIVIPDMPDLRAAAIRFDEYPVAYAAEKSFSFTVENKGPRPAGQVDVTARMNNRVVATQYTTVGAQSSQILTFTYKPVPGQQTLTVTVDAANALAESDETNNIITTSVNVLDLEAPVIHSVSVPPVIADQQPVAIQVKVTDNIGVANVVAIYRTNNILLSYNTALDLYEGTIPAVDKSVTALILRAQDVAGLSAQTSLSLNVRGLLPDLQISDSDIAVRFNGGRNPVITATVYNEGSNDALNCTVHILIDGVVVDTRQLTIAGSSQATLNVTHPVGFGEHQFAVIADPLNQLTEANEANNTGSKTAACFDLTAPAVPHPVAQQEGWSRQPEFRVTWRPVTDNDRVQRYEYTVDGTDWINHGTDTVATIVVAQGGVHDVGVRALDPSGNASEAGYTTLLYDPIAPDAPVITELECGTRWTNTSTPYLLWDAPQEMGSGIAGYALAINNAAPVALGNVLNHQTALARSGIYVMKVRAIDSLSNTGAWSNEIQVRLDVDMPSTAQIVSPTHPDGTVWYNSDSVRLVWNTPRDLSGVAGYHFLLNHEASTIPNRYSIIYPDTTLTLKSLPFITDEATQIPDGIWYFHLASTDVAGNTDTTGVHYRIQIDRSAPLTTARVSPGGQACTRVVQLTAEDFYAGVNDVYYSVNGGDWVQGTEFTVDATAAQTIRYYARDNANNIEEINTLAIPYAPLHIEHSVKEVSCHDAADGSINLTVTGGEAPYTFAWANGAITEDISGLSPGTYDVAVRDHTGCTQQASMIIQAGPPLYVGIARTGEEGYNISCFNGRDGQATVTVTGGEAPYTYAWSDGATSGNRTDLGAGTHTLLVTDNRGCSVAATVQLTQPPALKAILAPDQKVFLGYSAAACATLNVQHVTGGTAPYTYRWSTGETAQQIQVCPTTSTSYRIQITDAHQCMVEDTVTVDVEDVRCFTGNDRGSHGDYVTICHRNGNHTTTLCVPASTVKAHLAHGDYLGRCDEDHCAHGDCDPHPGMAVKVLPNPFSDVLYIMLTPYEDMKVTIDIIDVAGVSVAQIYSGQLNAYGLYMFDMEGKKLQSSGIYFCRIRTERGSLYEKVLYLR